MEIILLERIARLGGVGDIVKVKNGYARNYLIPQNMALRASEANRVRLEAQREQLEAQNAERKAAAEKIAATMQDVLVTVVRQASDDGRLYGSVAVRDVADALEAEGYHVDRRLIDLNQAIKNLGLYDVTINLHPEVHVSVKVHVARNADSPLPQELVEDEAQVAASDTQALEASDASDAEAQDEETAESGETPSAA